MSEAPLTDRLLWDEEWAGRRTRDFNPKRNYLHHIQDKLLSGKLSPGNKELLEVGCGSGKYLVHFAREFGYTVSGIDFSLKGTEMARRKLEEDGVEANIVHSDFFTYDFEKRYDVVFSAGFIEHFSDTRAVVEKMIGLTKVGGVLIATIPNFAGLLGTVRKAFNHEVYRQHKPITIKELSEIMNSFDLDSLEIGPLGSPVVPIPRNRRNPIFRTATAPIVLLNRLLVMGYRMTGIDLKHEVLSTQIYVYAKRRSEASVPHTA